MRYVNPDGSDPVIREDTRQDDIILTKLGVQDDAVFYGSLLSDDEAKGAVTPPPTLPVIIEPIPEITPVIVPEPVKTSVGIISTPVDNEFIKPELKAMANVGFISDDLAHPGQTNLDGIWVNSEAAAIVAKTPTVSSTPTYWWVILIVLFCIWGIVKLIRGK